LGFRVLISMMISGCYLLLSLPHQFMAFGGREREGGREGGSLYGVWVLFFFLLFFLDFEEYPK
jgi:hypothetical protein